jgi:hypothetical protein
LAGGPVGCTQLARDVSADVLYFEMPDSVFFGGLDSGLVGPVVTYRRILVASIQEQSYIWEAMLTVLVGINAHRIVLQDQDIIKMLVIMLISLVLLLAS